ncbi:MAG: DUF3667 domain-containing protein [Novosphingobium sp.]
MSDISESLAEIGQGALSGNAAEPSAGSGGADGHTHETKCLNCGTELIGSHCHTCGQAAHVHRTLGAFLHDLLHGVLHFEGKFWRTLPLLLWRPGKLTREYIDGRRASYLSPIALFLFFVFIMFAVFHATESEEKSTGGENLIEINRSVDGVEAEIDDLKAKRATLSAKGASTAELDKQIAEKQEAVDAVRALQKNGLGEAFSGKNVGSDIPQVDKAVRKFRENPDLALYKLQTYAYKFSWVLIPISVPFLWLLFPFSRRFHLYDHTVFVTYSLSFATLLVIVSMLAGAAGAAWVGAVLFFVPPIHMYRQLRETYALSRFGAWWRTWFLVAFAGTALLLFFMVIMAQTGS